jgi:hypothetical protein
MGIGCRLRGAEVAKRAGDDVQLAMAECVLAVSVHLTRRLDDSRELRLFDSRHRGARAGLQAVEAWSQVGRQDRMVSSGSVEGCTVNRKTGTGRLNRGTTHDDTQGAAFALWA